MNNEHPTNGEDNKTEKVDQDMSSFLFEKFSIWIFLIGLCASIWFQVVPLIVLLTFLIILSLFIFLWKRKALRHISPNISVDRSRIFVKDEFIITASIYNNKWLPLVWIEWEFPSLKGIVWGDSRQPKSLVRFLWVLWYQKLTWEFCGKAEKRGVFHLGKIKLRSGDGFRFTEVEKKYDLQGDLYVYPEILPVVIPSSQMNQIGESGQKGGFLEDPLLVEGIREYQAGDEWRRLNWKASARSGKLQTNVYQPIITQQIMIIFDMDGFVKKDISFDDPEKLNSYLKQKEDDFEWTLSVIASITIAFSDRGIHVGFSSNGMNYLGTQQASLKPTRQVSSILDSLAELIQDIPARKTDFIKLTSDVAFSGPLLIFCESITKEHYYWYKRNKDKQINVCFYYIVDNEYASRLGKHANPINTFLISKNWKD